MFGCLGDAGVEGPSWGRFKKNQQKKNPNTRTETFYEVTSDNMSSPVYCQAVPSALLPLPVSPLVGCTAEAKRVD